MTQQVVIGAGEVGTALSRVLTGSHLRDVEPSGPERADVLHICIRHSDDFDQVVLNYQREYLAGLVIVHSTVPVGTCDPYGWVHSPIRGRHPHLEEGIRTFVKHLGGVAAADAARLFDAVGVPTHTTPRAADTEAGKLWELVQYGVQIAVEKAIHEHCLDHAVSYDVAYRLMAETYNAGYAELGFSHFVRPVLEHVPGAIGGHCVVQNADMLDHPLSRLVVEASEFAAETEVD